MFDTIAAIATPLGPSGVGIVRVSGSDALMVADRLYRNAERQVPRTLLSARPSHQIHYGWLADPKSGAILDEVLVLVMRGPHSFTGEDVVEFQTHGAVAVLQFVLETCLALGVRLAAPGEFTKRAFLNGRMDLVRAEAIKDVIEARTERSLQVAIAQLEGRLSRQLARLRQRLIDLLARLEAAIDYPDEIGDLPFPELRAWLDGLLDEVSGLLATAHQGQIWREGATLAIIGRPNAGKSSLLNALLGRSRAIVTDIPGTTRDILEESLNLDGVPFRVLDTAGIRHTADVVESEGVKRSLQAMANADLVMLVVDLTIGVTDAETGWRRDLGDRPVVIVGNKQDCLTQPPIAVQTALDHLAKGAPTCMVSAVSGEGLPALSRLLTETVLGTTELQVSPTTVNARHRACLMRVRDALTHARAGAIAELPTDFIAIDTADAVAAISELTGDAIADEVINNVFEQFCVGK